MTTDLATLRALYVTTRNERAAGAQIDTNHVVALLVGAPADVVAAFAPLLNLTAAELAAKIAADVHHWTVTAPAKERAYLAALAKRRTAAKAREDRREAARLARETAATVTEW